MYPIIVTDGFASNYVDPSPLYAMGGRITNNNRFIQLYLPDHYFDVQDDYYPVIYFLHGFGQNYSSYHAFLTLVDTLIKEGSIPPVVVVKPDGMVSGYLGSFYTNSALGTFQDYITYELIPYIEQKYRVKKTSNNRALVGYGMGGCGALLHAFSRSSLFGSISCHLTYCSLVCPAIIGHAKYVLNVEQYNSELCSHSFNIINGPISFLYAAFEASEYSMALEKNLSEMSNDIFVDQLIIESPDKNVLLTDGALQIQEMTKSRNIKTILLKTAIDDDKKLKENNYSNTVPLRLIWPVIKNALKVVSTAMQCDGFTMSIEAVIALLTVGVNPIDYIRQNKHFILMAEHNGIKASEIFDDIPSAVARLVVDPKLFSIESDYETTRFKEALLMHGLYFLKTDKTR